MAALPTLPGLPGTLVMLEHINITVGEAWGAELEALWFGVLGAARDPRTKAVLERMYGEEEAAARGLVWANFGVQQVHLPCQPRGAYRGLPGLETWTSRQKIRGVIGLEYRAADLPALLARLAAAGSQVVTEVQEVDGGVEFTGVLGNRFRVEVVEGEGEHVGPASPLPAIPRLPGGQSLGLGIRYMEYWVPSGRALAAIGHQYSTVVGALVEQGAGGTSIQVHIGLPSNHQFLRFLEKPQVGEYEGDHLAVYVNDFLGMYRRARAVRAGGGEASIVWNNPCFGDCYDTEQLVLQQNQFRFKDFIDRETGEVVYQLEHEVRSLQHPNFQLHKDVFKMN